MPRVKCEFFSRSRYTQEVFCIKAPQGSEQSKMVTSWSNVVTFATICGPSHNVDSVINGYQESMLIDTGSVDSC